MRKRLLRRGTDAFESYELLEVLLYHIIPRRDTYEPAKRLIASHGGISGIFSSDKFELMKTEGIGEAAADFLCAISKLVNYKTENGTSISFRTIDDVKSYLIAFFGKEDTEATALLSIDNALRPISISKIKNTAFTDGDLNPALFVRAAAEERAAAVIIAQSLSKRPPFATDGELEAYRTLSDTFRKISVPTLGFCTVSRGEAYTFGMSDFKKISEKASTPCQESEKDGLLFGLLTAVLSKTEKNGAEIAKLLLSSLSTRDSLFTADRAQLLHISGSADTAELLTLISALASRAVTDGFKEGKKYSEEEIRRLISALYINRGKETPFLFSFDKGGRLISFDALSEGSVSGAELSSRIILDKAEERGAASVILAHNHPRGTKEPSYEDISATRLIKDALESAGIKFTAHYISSGGESEKFTK